MPAQDKINFLLFHPASAQSKALISLLPLKPLLILITLPINILTLGLFTFVINALLVLLASSVIKGFEVSGFWTAMLFSVVLSVVSYILNKLVKS